MSAFFASVLLGFLSFLLLVNLFSIRIPKQFALQKRLEEIKEKNTNKKTLNYKDDEFSFLYNNFRYKVFAQRFAGFKLTEKIKNEIMLSGVNMQVDTFIILSVMCVVPIATILLLTTPKFLLLSILGLFIPLNVLRKSYNAEIVDSIKFNNKYNSEVFEENKAAYLKLWFNLKILKT